METKRTVSAIILTLLILAVVYGVSEVAASPTKKLEVKTDKDVYCRHEDVKISITNIGDENVSLSCDLPFWILDETGSPVYPKDFLFWEIVITPGDTFNYVWNQMNDYTDTSVPLGKYTVETISELEPEPSKTFEIVVSPVGGFIEPLNISADESTLLAPYIGLASTILVATAATAIYVNRVKRRKKKQ